MKSTLSILKALCDETRLHILQMLSEQEMNVCQIKSAFDFSQPTISYHMKVLVDSGLILCRKEGSCSFFSVNEKKWFPIRELLYLLDDTFFRK